MGKKQAQALLPAEAQGTGVYMVFGRPRPLVPKCRYALEDYSVFDLARTLVLVANFLVLVLRVLRPACEQVVLACRRSACGPHVRACSSRPVCCISKPAWRLRCAAQISSALEKPNERRRCCLAAGNMVLCGVAASSPVCGEGQVCEGRPGDLALVQDSAREAAVVGEALSSQLEACWGLKATPTLGKYCLVV